MRGKDKAYVTPGEQYHFGPFQLDVTERELRRDGELVALTAKTFDLLLLLVQGAGRTFTKSELLEALWPGTVVEESNLSQTIFLLRKALGESGESSNYIVTLPRRGYKFIGSVRGRASESVVAAPLRSTWRFVAIGFGAGVAVAAAVLGWVGHQPPGSTALRYQPFAFEQGGQNGAVWSPDGKAVAFGARQKSTQAFQVYVRYLDSPGAAQITHLADGENALPIAWTTTGRIVFWSPRRPAGLWSISPVGGDPEPLLSLTDNDTDSSVSISPDGSAVALLHRTEEGVFSVWISSPPGTPAKPYSPAPFASRAYLNVPGLKFSPNGKKILMFRNATRGEEAWLIPYPSNPADPPRRVLKSLPTFGGTPSFSWMPDNRHVVVSTTTAPAIPNQLYLADTASEEYRVLSAGTTYENAPAVSPDGNKLVFQEATRDCDVVSLDLATAAVTPLIATQRCEEMPSWASEVPALAYVTDRNAEPEIWLHQPGQPDRPLVTPRDFSRGRTRFLIGPVLSPDANRLIYNRRDPTSSRDLWMSAVAGGEPVLLVKGTREGIIGGSWSPDGKWIVYWSEENRSRSLKKVKATGQAEPEILKQEVHPDGLAANYVPVWSPAGDWILHSDHGLRLTSPDGRATRDLGPELRNAICTFSRDGKLLYCLRVTTGTGQSPRPERSVTPITGIDSSVQLFSADLEGKLQDTIGTVDQGFAPNANVVGGGRLALAPDGRSIAYTILKPSFNLWLIDGLKAFSGR